MLKKFLILVFFVLFIYYFSFAQQEEITFTTYYPSPYGSYGELDTNYLNYGRVSSPPASGDTCSAQQEGRTFYSTSAKTLLICNGANWVTLGGSGRTSCPSGYTLIGTAGNGAFCISSARETASTWGSAVTNCYNKNPHARLCSGSEWMTACVSSANSLGMFNDYATASYPSGKAGEFVAEWSGADSESNVYNIAGHAKTCSSAENTQVASVYPSRCCLY